MLSGFIDLVAWESGLQLTVKHKLKSKGCTRTDRKWMSCQTSLGFKLAFTLQKEVESSWKGNTDSILKQCCIGINSERVRVGIIVLYRWRPRARYTAPQTWFYNKIIRCMSMRVIYHITWIFELFHAFN